MRYKIEENGEWVRDQKQVGPVINVQDRNSVITMLRNMYPKDQHGIIESIVDNWYGKVATHGKAKKAQSYTKHEEDGKKEKAY